MGLFTTPSRIDKVDMIVYSQKMQTWFVYIIECSDTTLYTGITTDITRRVCEHNSGTGARYTRARLPVKLVFITIASDRSSASKLEYTIKQLSRKQKLALIEEGIKTGSYDLLTVRPG